MTNEVDYKSAPIDPDFMSKPDVYPVTGEHHTHKISGEGKDRNDADGKSYPTKLGIHGTHVAVDWDSCIGDGACMDVCPVEVFEWELAPGTWGTGKDTKVEKDSERWGKYRTDKCDPIREDDCIDCMACETACPVLSIKITPG